MGKVTQKRTDGKQMSASVLEQPVCPFEMKRKIRQLGKPLIDGEKKPSRIERVAHHLGLTTRKTRSYWDAEIENPRPEHFAKVKRLLGEPLEERASDEFKQLEDRISRLEAALHVSDPEFHSPFIEFLRSWSEPKDRSLD